MKEIEQIMEKGIQALGNAAGRIQDNVQSNVQEETQKRIDEQLFLERNRQTKRAAAAMLDAGLTDEKVFQMLQKHWDLNSTQARITIKQAHKLLDVEI